MGVSGFNVKVCGYAIVLGPVIINYNPTSVHSPTFTLCICSYSPCLSFNPIGQSYSWCCESLEIFKYKSYLLYINISSDSRYFRCPDEEQFYPFEILAFRTLKL